MGDEDTEGERDAEYRERINRKRTAQWNKAANVATVLGAALALGSRVAEQLHMLGLPPC